MSTIFLSFDKIFCSMSEPLIRLIILMMLTLT